MGFDDLLAANAEYAKTFHDHEFDGKARRGVLVLTCMDSRIEPLAMMGLGIGDAKILRTPGGFLTSESLVGCIVGIHKLGVNRIMVIQHTRCAMASSTDDAIRKIIASSAGRPADDLVIGADTNQRGHLASDIATLRDNEFIAGHAEVGGFIYDVDWGHLTQVL